MRPTQRRTALRRAALTGSALVLLAGAGGAVAAGQVWAPPAPPPQGAAVVTVPPGPVQAVCAGPATLTTGQGTAVAPEVDPADVTPAATTTVASLSRDGGAGAATYTPLGGEAAEVPPAGTARLLSLTPPPGPGILRADPAGESAALVAGATVTRTNAGDLRGLAAAPCLTPATTTWLVGGATAPGQSAQLVLTNPGPTPAAVAVTLWTSLGPAEAPRLAELTVAPGGQQAVLLEGAAIADPALALRVAAAGGQVTATLQDLRLDGLVPAGIDAAAPAAAPATELTIPGVVLTETTAGDVAPSVVRLVNPGEAPATAALTLLGPDGESAIPGADAVVLDPGAVTEVSLAGLPAGAHAVRVRSDAPLTGAVALTRTGAPGPLDPDTAPVDRAWTAAARPLTTGVLVVPGLDGPVQAAVVTLTNPGPEETTVTLTAVSTGGAEGRPVEVTVPAESTRTVPVSDLGPQTAAVRLDAGTEVAAAVVLTAAAADGELIAALPLTPDPHAARSVRVQVR